MCLVGNCSAGYWCKEGAVEEHPQDGLSGELCPRGHYCPEGILETKTFPFHKHRGCIIYIWLYFSFLGTHSPLPCPAGTWSDSEGLRSQTECQPCPGGHYCNSSGQTTFSGQCAPGWERYISLLLQICIRASMLFCLIPKTVWSGH